MPTQGIIDSVTSPHLVEVGSVAICNDRPFVLISGPCQMESLQHSLDIAGRLQEITASLNIGFIFKSSFDKANRTSIDGQRGVGFESGLMILDEVKRTIGCPTLTDVHESAQCDEAAHAVDVLQIPAFLCRQTDLLVAAGNTGVVVNIKKGQFLAPWDIVHAAVKVSSTGNKNILLCERGTCFGYNALVTDMRSLTTMAALGYPVVIDGTHSVQQPGGLGSASGGQRELVPTICRAAVAVGVAAVFIETHENPDSAPSDGETMIPLQEMPELLEKLQTIDRAVKFSDQN